jgi:hypothetical protein
LKSSRTRALAVLLVFAVIGSVFIFRSFAANPNLPGDVNNDNVVNITDLSMLLSAYGKPGTAADFNGDGQVGITDLSILLTNYGRTTGGNPNPNPNPNPGPATFPLRVSANKRYLEGANGVPFLMVADTAWNMSAKLNDAELAQYLDARKNQGFNTVLTSIMDINKGSMGNTVNRAGVRPGSYGSPNGAYFDHMVKVLKMAEDRGIVLAILPAWSQHADKDSGYNPTTAASWGTFAANKFLNSPNLIWVTGGDYGGSPEGDCPIMGEVKAMANAIKAVDNRHIMTHHPGIDQSSNTCYKNESWLDFSGSYWDFNYSNVYSTYRNVLRDYNSTPTRPAVSVETGYEGPWGEQPDDQLTARTSRMQSAHQVLAGGLGFSYGANATYEMKNNEGKTWQQTITEKGGRHQGYVAKAFNTRAWWTLVPDQNRSVLTAGGGNSGDANYAAAGRSADGKLVMVYSPNSKNLTVDMTKLSATATARWYDPTNGQYRAITGSPFPNTGSRQFQTPGNNSDGDPDWILILETNPPN